jgi:putative ABC transport system ATP-binding protein
MSDSKAVVVDRVIKIYESRGEKVTALREVSLSVDEGEVVTVMGPSGSGKTTLMNLIAGVDKPTAGKVIVYGRMVHRMSEEELRRYRLEVVGYVFQQHNLIPTLTALENVLLPMSLAGKRDPERAKRLLRQVGLQGKEERFPEELSGGEQQRLAVAVALANEPRLVIADEPTGELDLATGEKVVKLLIAQSREAGRTVVITTHDPRVARMTDRVILLEDGRIRGSYSPQKLGVEGPSGEVAVERVIVEYFKRLLDDVRTRKEKLAERLARGEISIDELVEEYNRLRSLEEAIIGELSRLGAGVEAL